MPASTRTSAFDDSEFDDPRFDDPAFFAGDLFAAGPTPEDKTGGTIAHLSGFAGLAFPLGNVLAPLVVWLIKRDSSAFIAENARAALNFQITLSIAFLIAIVLSFIVIGIPLLLVAGIAWLVLPVIGAVRANEGQVYRYPATVEWVKRPVG